MAAEISGLEAALGHEFAAAELLEHALTHRSLLHERGLHEKGLHENGLHEKGPHEKGSARAQAADSQAADPRPGDNERLEFLGDAVLGLVVGEALFQLHPEWSEGELTRMRAQLVSRQHIAQVAGAIDLGRYLRLSKGEDRSGLRRKSTVLSNTMEAVLGALFLDGGLEPVRAFVRQRVMGEEAEQLAREMRSGAALGNYKSALQEHLQATRAGTPVYRVKNESGPDHRKRFLVEVRLRSIGAGEPGKALARGLGRTKKHAEQDAARRALDKLAAAANGSARAARTGEKAAE